MLRARNLPDLLKLNSNTLPTFSSVPVLSSRRIRSVPRGRVSRGASPVEGVEGPGGGGTGGPPRAGPLAPAAAASAPYRCSAIQPPISPEKAKRRIFGTLTFSPLVRLTISAELCTGRRARRAASASCRVNDVAMANHIESSENDIGPPPSPAGNLYSCVPDVLRTITSLSPSSGATRYANHLPSGDKLVVVMARNDRMSSRDMARLVAFCAEIGVRTATAKTKGRATTTRRRIGFMTEPPKNTIEWGIDGMVAPLDEARGDLSWPKVSTSAPGHNLPKGPQQPAGDQDQYQHQDQDQPGRDVRILGG